MDDATQKLVDGLREAEKLIWYDGAPAENYTARAAILSALEAAQRPPVAEPDNHHNADVCPFCTRNRDEREAAIRAEALAQRPPVSPVLDAINDAREAVARGERPSIIIDTDDYPAQERPPEGEAFAEAFERFSMGLDYSNRDEAEAGFRAGWEAAQRPPVSPEQREALEWAGIKALVESPEVPTGVRALLIGEVFTIREAVDAEPVVRVVLDALLARFSLPVLDVEKNANPRT